MPEATSYQLEICIERPVRVRVGRLGFFLFPAGTYVYTGSAKRNIDARLARHLRKKKTKRWHIDWLLAARDVAITAVRRSRRSECEWNQSIAGTAIVAGFGASDCRSGCGSHLLYLGQATEVSS